MLCISLWMLVLEAQELGDRAVGLWRTLVTEDLDAAEDINPNIPLPDTIDEVQTRNLIKGKWYLLCRHGCLITPLLALTCCVRDMMHSIVMQLDQMMQSMTHVCDVLWPAIVNVIQHGLHCMLHPGLPQAVCLTYSICHVCHRRYYDWTWQVQGLERSR